MRLPSIFRKTKQPDAVTQVHDDQLATQECSDGFEQLQQGRLQLAQASFDRAIRANPAHFDALQLRGIVALQQGDTVSAISFLQRAVTACPSDAGVHSNLGLALDGAGRSKEAIASFREAIRLQPSFTGAFINSSLSKRKLGDFDGALTDLMCASSLEPQSAEVKSALGDLFQQRGQHGDARRVYFEATILNPQLLATRINLSQTLMELGDHTAALAQCDAAIALHDSSFEAHLNRALALYKLKRFEESLSSSERAIQLEPGNCLAHANYGATLEEDRQLTAALAAYDTALSIEPENAAVHVNKGIVLLLMGELSHGFKEYDWRWKDPVWLKDKPRFSKLRWTGQQSINGKSILVHNDQGLGDVMQFSRYIPPLVAAGARVTLEVPKPLVGLLSHADTGAACLQIDQPRPAFDMHTTFSDLPLALGTSLESIPPPTRFNVQESKTSFWIDRLGAKSGPRVGLVWKGNPKHNNDANRSIPLALLLATLPDAIDATSLQNELNESDQNLLSEHPNIRNCASDLKDFEETAALCSLMDVVITVDTSVAHLAGSLGKTTWLLLPYLPDWRWLLNRIDTPWYLSMTLLRQPTPGDWQPVLRELALRLKALSS